MKVYVLVRDIAFHNEDTDIQVRTYASISDARVAMKKEYNAELIDWKQSFDNDEMFEVETSPNARSIWESGRYLENHIVWKIYQQDVL